MMQLTLDDTLTMLKIAIILIAHTIQITKMRNVHIEDFVADTTKANVLMYYIKLHKVSAIIQMGKW